MFANLRMCIGKHTKTLTLYNGLVENHFGENKPGELLNRIKEAYGRDYVKIISVFLFFFFVFSLVYFSVNRFTSTDDQFFNIRFAQIVRSHGLGAFNGFHWIYFSKFSLGNQAFFSDPLFYVAMVPFTFVNPLFLGIKLAAVLFASLIFTFFYFFLLKLREKHAFIWTIAFFSILNYAYVWKMLMARSFVIAPAVLLVLLYFAHTKKYYWVFGISFIYFFWHIATFFFPLGVVVLYFLFENFYGKRFDWKLIIYSSGGLLLAVFATAIFFPKGFANFVYSFHIIYGIFHDTIIGKSVPIAEGSELYAGNFFDVLKENTFLIFLLVISVSYEIYRYVLWKKSGKRPLGERTNKSIIRGVLFFLSILFLFGTFITSRNVDFFNLFAMAYVALAVNAVLGDVCFENAATRKSIAYGIIIVLVYLFVGNGLFLEDTISSSGAYDKIKGAADWLRANTKQGEVVFNATWNWFPTLFYYDTHNYYIAGAEPRDFYDYNPDLYWAWSNISSRGYLCLHQSCDLVQAQQRYYLRNEKLKKIWYEKEGDTVANYIVNNFKSHYVVTSKNFTALNDLMNNSERFERVYADNGYGEFFIYKIK